MVITEAQIAPYRLPLRQPWTTARGTIEEREGWLLRLRTESGYTGWGDCSPLDDFGTESMDAAYEALRTQSEQLEGRHAEAAIEVLDAGRTPAARCALETAVLDIMARAAGVPLSRYLNRDAVARIAVNASAGTLDEGAAERARSAEAAGFNVIKFKVGVADADRELAQLHALVKRLRPETRLRLDANRAWDDVTARAFIAGLRQLPVESLEEPLRNPDADYLKRLQAEAPCALALDESLPELDAGAVCAERAVNRLVLKPAVLGGPMAALRLAHCAFQAGIECVVTTTLESAAGRWAAVHLAAAVDALEGRGLAHGLATGEWFAADIGTGPDIRGARFDLPDSPGAGFQPKRRGGER